MPDNDVEVIELSEQDLTEQVSTILGTYPWMKDYPFCHGLCARRDITEQYGDDAARAWTHLRAALYLLGED